MSTPGTLNQYTVVNRARSSARLPLGQGFEYNLSSAPAFIGPIRIRIITRWVDSGHAEPLPRELIIEVVGQDVSIDEATRRFSVVARIFAALVGFVANVRVGAIETHLAYDSTEGRDEREFLEVFLPDEIGSVADGRFVDIDLLSAVCVAYFTSTHNRRLSRAIHQYELALREWTLGSEYLALNRLFAAAEALTPAALKKHLQSEGITKEQLALSYGADMTRSAEEWAKYLHARCRQHLVFGGDETTHSIAGKARNGLQHGSLDLNRIAAHAVEAADKTFTYIRCAISDLLDLPAEVKAELDQVKVRDVQSLRKIIRARLINAESGNLAAEGELYPQIEWSSGVSGVTRDDTRLSYQETSKFTFRLADEVRMELDRLEVRGRIEDGRVPVQFESLNEQPQVFPQQPTVARDLLDATMQLINRVTMAGQERTLTFPGHLAFRLFGLGTAAFEATKVLLERDQPFEALLTFRTVVIVAARMEQIRSDGHGVAIRNVLDHLSQLAKPSIFGVPTSERVQELDAERQALLVEATSFGISVPDQLERVEDSAVWQSVAVEMGLVDIMLQAGDGAARAHMRGGPTAEHHTFHTATEQDVVSDMIASATVIAQLRNLELTAELLEWPFDHDKLNQLAGQAHGLNERSAGNPQAAEA